MFTWFYNREVSSRSSRSVRTPTPRRRVRKRGLQPYGGKLVTCRPVFWLFFLSYNTAIQECLQSAILFATMTREREGRGEREGERETERDRDRASERERERESLNSNTRTHPLLLPANISICRTACQRPQIFGTSRKTGMIEFDDRDWWPRPTIKTWVIEFVDGLFNYRLDARKQLYRKGGRTVP